VKPVVSRLAIPPEWARFRADPTLIFPPKTYLSRENSPHRLQAVGLATITAATFSLMTYGSAPLGESDQEEVLERRMLPSAPSKVLANCAMTSITQEELHLIADWVEGGSRKASRR